MANDQNEMLDPEEVNSMPVDASPSTPESADSADSADATDPADEIPVPVAMSPAEIDERAQAVDAVRGNSRIREPRDDESRMDA